MLCFLGLNAQEYFPKNDGVKSQNENYIAFTNARIHLNPDQVIKNGSLLIQNGKVTNSGQNISFPDNTMIIDLKGKSIYPSFIDVYSNFGIKDQKATDKSSNKVQYDSKRQGYYRNEHITPEKSAFSEFKFDDKKANF